MGNSPYEDRCNGGEILSGTYERITARTVSVDMHFKMPCSRARDIPKVLFPVPGPPLMRINFGGSFLLLKGGGELNVRRCFMEADNAVCKTTSFFGGLNPNAERMDAASRMAAADKWHLIMRLEKEVKGGQQCVAL
jgi:hypothetical protein